MPNSSGTNVALLNGTSAAASSAAALPRFHRPPTSSASSSSFPKGSFFSSAASAVTASTNNNHRPTTEPLAPETAAAFLMTNGTVGHIENGGNGQQPLTVILTVRMLMQGKEVGSIIGKRGDYVRQIREQSGAKINISDGSCPERIVTILGSSTSINKAFVMVAQKFEEDMQAQQNATMQKPPITLRLLVPASQCGSLIGKGGAKIREIRDKTGASLQVASEMLSNSTEKAVTISGTSEALIGCMREVCQILLDAPAKGPTIQYKPVGQAYNPLAVANSAATIAAAAAAVSAAQQQQHKVMPGAGLGTAAHGTAAGALSTHATATAQLAALLSHANPALFSVHEQLALLQQIQQQPLLLPQNPNPFPCVDPIVSRFLLHPNAAAAAAAGLPSVSSSSAPTAAAASNALLANHPSLLINHLHSTVPSTAANHQKVDGMELYGAAGLDPTTLALLQQQQQNQHQQQHQTMDAMVLLQQQQQMILYQQQQQQNDTGHENQLIGRAIGSGGKAEKKKSSDGSVAASSGATAHQQKRFTPY